MLTTTDYGVPFVSAVQKGNVLATQVRSIVIVFDKQRETRAIPLVFSRTLFKAKTLMGPNGALLPSPLPLLILDGCAAATPTSVFQQSAA